MCRERPIGAIDGTQWTLATTFDAPTPSSSRQSAECRSNASVCPPQLLRAEGRTKSARDSPPAYTRDRLLLALLLAAQPSLAYVVRAPVDQPHVEVHVTRGEHASRGFEFARRGPVDVITVTTASNETRRVPVDDRGDFLLPDDWASFRYTYAPSEAEMDLSFGATGPEGLVLTGRTYLVKPRPLMPGLPITFRTEGRAALTPWTEGQPLTQGHLVEPGFHAFGGRRCERRAGATTLAIALFGKAEPGTTDVVLCDWLQRSAHEANLVKPGLPKARLAIVALGVPSREPAVFGIERDSDPPSLTVLFGQRAKRQSFTLDWVAVHELLHAVHPRFEPELPWLAEGFSTYFTEVARARSGRKTPKQAWSELADGFRRGTRQANGRPTRAFTEGRITGDYQAAYWSGAFFALTLDVALRARSHGRLGLEDAFAQVPSPCTEAELAAAVDALHGSPLWSPTLERQKQAPALEGTATLLESLGVRAEGGSVALSPAPHSRIREVILRPGPELPSRDAGMTQ